MVMRITQNISLALLLAFCFVLSGCGWTHHKSSINGASTPDYAYLAPTPPMGWNSWNIFAKDINEVNIKAAADAMVSSGMRDAGYRYLVLDDAWMAAERDENGAGFESGAAHHGGVLDQLDALDLLADADIFAIDDQRASARGGAVSDIVGAVVIDPFFFIFVVFGK